MKTNLFSTILLMATVLLFCQCTKTEFDDFPKEEKMENLPESSKQLGLAVAKELNTTIRNLHKQGVDYTTANETPEFKEVFYNDFFKASPSAIKTRSSISDFNINPEEFVRRVNNLTNIQREFLNRIIDECGASTTGDEFYAVLIEINNDIYTTVPEIQQERLFNVTSVLYYSMKEMQKIENQGLMIPTPRSNMKHMLVKTRSESGGSFGETCTKVLATSMAVAIATPIPGDEVVVGAVITAVATGYAVYTAGVWLYEYIVCSKRNRVDCTVLASDCVYYKKYGSYDCNECYRECMNDGAWPYYKCPINR